MSKVRGGGPECQAVMAQEGPRGATLRPRPGAVARRSYFASEVRGNDLEEPPRVRGHGWGLGGGTPRPGPGVAPGRATHVQGAVAALAQEGLEELSHVEGQEGRQ